MLGFLINQPPLSSLGAEKIGDACSTLRMRDTQPFHQKAGPMITAVEQQKAERYLHHPAHEMREPKK